MKALYLALSTLGSEKELPNSGENEGISLETRYCSDGELVNLLYYFAVAGPALAADRSRPTQEGCRVRARSSLA